MKIVLSILCIPLFKLCSPDYYSPEHKYRIDYTEGRYQDCDFTDEYSTDSNGCIKYYDGYRNVIRCGSFSIIELK